MRRVVLIAWVAQACATSAPDRGRAVLNERPVPNEGFVLSCEPADAQVEVDGVPRGACSDFGRPRPLKLGPGMHRVDVTKDGFERYQTYVELGGAQAQVETSLKPLVKN